MLTYQLKTRRASVIFMMVFVMIMIGLYELDHQTPEAVYLANAFELSSPSSSSSTFSIFSRSNQTINMKRPNLSVLSRQQNAVIFAKKSQSFLSSSTAYTPFNFAQRTSTSTTSTTPQNNNSKGNMEQFLYNNRNQKPNTSNHNSNITSKILKPFTTPTLPTVMITIISLLYNMFSSASVRQSINTCFIKFPYVAAFVICALKASIADLVVQKSMSSTSTASSSSEASSSRKSKTRFEYKRNIAFFFYGGAYQGCVQEHIFNHIYPAVFGNGVDIRTVAMKVMLDIFFVTPFINLPVAYSIKGGIYKDSILSSMKRYFYDIKVNRLLHKNWMGEYVALFYRNTLQLMYMAFIE